MLQPAREAARAETVRFAYRHRRAGGLAVGLQAAQYSRTGRESSNKEFDREEFEWWKFDRE